MSEQFGLYTQGDGTAVLTIDGRPVLRVDASPAHVFEHAVRRTLEVRAVSVYRLDESFSEVKVRHVADLASVEDQTAEAIAAAGKSPWGQEPVGGTS